MCKISLIDKISFLLIIIGALNWGIFGLFNFDLIHFVFGFSDILTRSLYILVGLAGVNIIKFLYCLNKK